MPPKNLPPDQVITWSRPRPKGGIRFFKEVKHQERIPLFDIVHNGPEVAFIIQLNGKHLEHKNDAFLNIVLLISYYKLTLTDVIAKINGTGNPVFI